MRDGETVRLRTVLLWGRLELVDEHGRVFCTGCGRLLEAVVLGRPDNTHRAGRRASSSGIWPMGGDELDSERPSPSALPERW